MRIERPTCCWTRCDNEQGAGTWTEINGETLPICEEHWFGNLDAERRRLRDYAERMDALAEERLIEIVRLRSAIAAYFEEDDLDTSEGILRGAIQ